MILLPPVHFVKDPRVNTAATLQTTEPTCTFFAHSFIYPTSRPGTAALLCSQLSQFGNIKLKWRLCVYLVWTCLWPRTTRTYKVRFDMIKLARATYVCHVLSVWQGVLRILSQLPILLLLTLLFIKNCVHAKYVWVLSPIRVFLRGRDIFSGD